MLQPLRRLPLPILLLLLPACDGAGPGAGEPARLVVEAAAGVDAGSLAAALAEALDSPVELEPLFGAIEGDDPEGLGRMYVVRAQRARRDEETDWDVAHRAREAPEVRQAEPDDFATLERTTAEARSACFVADDLAPQDTAWSLRAIRAPEAWRLAAPSGAASRGEGVRICHPDTGWTTHVDLDPDRLDLASALDLLTPGGDARDPLEPGRLLHPGHGTATGSVLISAGDVDAGGATPPGLVTGIAPAATLVPIRTAKSVVQIFDSDLARAVRHAVDAGCDVVSMSLGGRWFFGLRAAIRDAVAHDIVVVAAAGNCVRMVVAPAAYDECIAVAGVDHRDGPWRGTSRGSAVTVSGPAEHVWAAEPDAAQAPGESIASGQGTSYAAASVAGVAALWLARRGPEARARYAGRVPLQSVFAELLEETARAPAGWNTEKHGAGIVDAARLVSALLPELAEIEARLGPRLVSPSATRPFERVFDVEAEKVRSAVSEYFGVPAEELGDWLETHGAELLHLAMEQPQAFYRMVGEEAEEPAARQAPRREAAARLEDRASQRLRSSIDTGDRAP